MSARNLKTLQRPIYTITASHLYNSHREMLARPSGITSAWRCGARQGLVLQAGVVYGKRPSRHSREWRLPA